MLTKNFDVNKGLANGARSVVAKFMSDLGGKIGFTLCLFYTVFRLF